MQDGNRQPDRQTEKEHNCWSSLLHQELKPHEAAVFASDYDHSLIDVDEFQNRTKTSKIKARCLLFDYLVNQTAAASIAEHHTPSTVTVYSAPSEPQAAVNASATFCNPQKCFYCWIMHKHYCLAWENHELWLWFSNLSGLNIKI